MVMAEIIGPLLVHQLPLHNRRGGVGQPSLVMNHHHIDCLSGGHEILHAANLNIKNERESLCVGCGGQIHDQYILRVAPDLEWHAACLKCQECQQFLDESCTCFVRDGKTYCKRDYVRLFGTKCDKCGSSFSKNDFVMRAKTKVYHIECFRCSACSRQLIPGDEFALREGGSLYCKKDHDVLADSLQISLTPQEHNNNSSILNNNNSSNIDRNIENTNLSNTNHSSELGSMSDSENESISPKSIKRKTSVSSDGKTTRARTVLNEKQLHTLSSCYNANPRPDALMKEQMVEMTGLSPRVIRVWFQNKRCKDNKKAIAMKLQIQQEKEGKKLGYGGMQGIPMVASSPIQHDSPVNGLEVTAYQPPWKALSDFAMHADLDGNGSLDTQNPAFHHLVNQMHGYINSGGMHHSPHQNLMASHMDLSSHHPESADSYLTYLDNENSSQESESP